MFVSVFVQLWGRLPRQRCKCGHVVNMCSARTFEQVFARCVIEVREAEWLCKRNERERERE